MECFQKKESGRLLRLARRSTKLGKRLFIYLSVRTWITMKRIEIIIPHRKLEAVHEILKNVNAGGMIYYKIEGAGNIKAEPIAIGRGTMQSRVWHVPRTKVEVVVKDDQVAELIPRITESLGSDLGGKIFVVDIPVAVDVRTKKSGEDAIKKRKRTNPHRELNSF